MKIAFVYDAAYPWHVGGVEAVNHNEAVALAKENEIDFFSMRWPGMKEEFEQDGIRYHAHAATNQERFYRHERRSVREALSFALSLLGIFRYKHDVVITNYFPILHLPVVYLYCKLRGARMVMQVVEVWDRRYWTSYLGPLSGRLAHWYASLLLRIAPIYVANSSATKASMVEAGIDQKRIEVFSPVLDEAELRGVVARGNARRTVLFSGRLIREKRMDVWLRTVKQASRIADFKAVIIGDGPEKGNVEREIADMELGSVVSMRGFYTKRDDLYAAIKGAKVFLNTSGREGLSVITIESIALGTPVLLPSYSPIPRELKEMCVVDAERNLARRLAEMINSDSKSDYIKRRGNLKQFQVSRIREFYSMLFARLR